MSTSNSDGNYPPHNKDKEPTTDTAKNSTLNLTKPPNNLHTDIIAARESNQPGIPVQPLPSFDVAHRGWDASNVPTAKCDLCHRHRCGTLQKCRVCKLSICRECCVGGRLRNDRRHAIDAGAVEWNAPPSLRKRKLQAMETEEVMFQGPKRQKANGRRGRGRGHEREAVDEDKDILGSCVVASDEAAQAPDGERQEQSDVRFHGYGHAYPMEPRLSVAPASHYPFVSRAQNMDVISTKYTPHYEREAKSLGYKRLPASEEIYNNGDNDEEYGASLSGESYHAASNPGLSSRRIISSVNDFSRAAPSRPVLPPISPLHRDRHMQHQQPNEIFRTSPDVLSRLERLPYHYHHHQQPFTSEFWPPHEHTDSLGTALADAASASHRASSPPKPLDHCLRDELQALWTSRAFVAQDPDAGRRYRRLLAAAYLASARLGLEPRGSAAREWLCAEERRLREMGCEPTRTAQLMDFIQEVGIWYLRQAQC
ncbi:hypothetical protein V8C35DRAFT_283063 [Trichoderma chlorosporum]